MTTTVKLKQRLFIQKPPNPLSAPQKCKIAVDINFPAGSLVIVTNEVSRYLCKLYYLPDHYSSLPLAQIDDSVQLHPAVREEGTFLSEIELIPNSDVVFKSVRINLVLSVDEIDLEAIKNPDQLKYLTVSILKSYKFTAECSISCNRHGISKISISETDVPGYGSASASTEVAILSISIESGISLGWRPLGGVQQEQDELSKIISSNLDFIKHPESFKFPPNFRTLITGPVGSGKTSIVHDLSRRHNCILFEITTDIFRPYPGETEEALMKLFQKIHGIRKIITNQVVIVLLDNIDIFCPRFNPHMKDFSHSSRISSMLFKMMEDLRSMVLIGTTSKLDALNDKFRRICGREIMLDMPDEGQRKEIIEIIMKEIEIVDPKVLQDIAERTAGFVGADLEVLCHFVERKRSDDEKICIEEAFNLALNTVTPSVQRDNLGSIVRSNMKLSDIGGYDELKKILETSVIGPLRHPEVFRRFGLKSSKGILLYGPSGCAKTTFVKCLAGEAKMTLIAVSSAEIYSPYVGEAEKFIVKLFNQARMGAPSILFFDEIDTIVGNRQASGGENDSHMRILSTLLTEIDGFSTGSTKTVLIIGATNKPEMIDDALMRPGRFDKLIHVPAPDIPARLEILKFISKKMPLAEDVDLSNLAELTKNFSGADVVNLCTEAALNAATKDLKADLITKQDFEDVLTFLRPSLREKQIEFYKNFEGQHRNV